MKSHTHQYAAGWVAATALALLAGFFAPQAGAAPAAPAPPAPTSSSAKPRDAAKMASLRKFLRQRMTTYAGTKPASPNPSLALLPGWVRPDYQGWAEQAAQLSAARVNSRAHRASRARVAVPGLTYSETEGPGERGYNDTTSSAEMIAGFGTGSGDEAAATILGTMNPVTVPGYAYTSVKPNQENDGNPRKARDLGVSDRRIAIKTTGYRGDGPGTGNRRKDDIDFYKLSLKAGERLSVSVATTKGNLKPTMALIDKNYNLVGDSFPQFGKKVKLDVGIRQDDTYYLLVSGWTVFGIRPNGPTTGAYQLKAAAAPGDTDSYAVDLAAGDVLAATLNTKGFVTVSGPTGGESHGSNQDGSFMFPAASPLPGARGRGLSEYVAREPGRYYVQYNGGRGAYIGSLEVYRHGGAGAASPQKIYLDFDGARVNTGMWGGYGVVELSPLWKFLPRWGLDSSQEADLIAGIKANVMENVQADLAANGLSSTVDVELTTSLDGPDLTGQPGVTTVVVGGSIRESGLPTIGIAESIDPGNFQRTEKALVLLDLLSAPADRWASYSLNSYLTPESDRLAFVAQGIGNVASHEIGHLLGSWHTDNSNKRSSMMDAGGLGFGRVFGVGNDRIGGTTDDKDVDFVVDTYDLGEGFFGREDTLTRSTFAMSN